MIDENLALPLLDLDFINCPAGQLQQWAMKQPLESFRSLQRYRSDIPIGTMLFHYGDPLSMDFNYLIPRKLQRGNFTGQADTFYCSREEATARAEVKDEGAPLVHVSVRRTLKALDLTQSIGPLGSRFETETEELSFVYDFTAMIAQIARRLEFDALVHWSAARPGGVNVMLFDKESYLKQIAELKFNHYARLQSSLT
jgi:hypothetical protein